MLPLRGSTLGSSPPQIVGARPDGLPRLRAEHSDAATQSHLAELQVHLNTPLACVLHDRHDRILTNLAQHHLGRGRQCPAHDRCSGMGSDLSPLAAASSSVCTAMVRVSLRKTTGRRSPSDSRPTILGVNHICGHAKRTCAARRNLQCGLHDTIDGTLFLGTAQPASECRAWESNS